MDHTTTVRNGACCFVMLFQFPQEYPIHLSIYEMYPKIPNYFNRQNDLFLGHTCGPWPKHVSGNTNRKLSIQLVGYIHRVMEQASFKERPCQSSTPTSSWLRLSSRLLVNHSEIKLWLINRTWKIHEIHVTHPRSN
jgi:hypothetical protein